MKTLCKPFSLLVLLILLVSGCSDDTTMVSNNPNDPMTSEATIWAGSNLTFDKQDGGDPTDVANQDKLTDLVIITRGTTGGQIFNIAAESGSNKTNSPTGTEWAKGTTSDLTNLTFAPFRETVINPKEVVGIDLVLHLIDDDIYLNLVFTSWTSGKAGGFTYQRATP